MAAKRGKKQARRSGESSVPGFVWLLVGLMIGGAAIAVYLKMPHAADNLLPHPNPTAHAIAATDSGVATTQTAPPKTPAAPKKPQYDFYTLLPEKEVIIPDEELSAQVKAEAAAKLASQQQALQPLTPGAAAGSASNSTTIVSNVANPPAAVIASNATNANTISTPAAPTPVPASAAPEKPGQYLLQAGAFRNGAQADDLKAHIAMLGLIGRVEIVQTPSGPMHRVRLGPYATASELESAKQKLSGGGLPAVAIRVK